MNINSYLSNREQQRSEAATSLPRENCFVCFQSRATCYCADLSPIDPGFEIVILIHPFEARRRIATGRMSHLNLRNSLLIEGESFTENDRVNEILKDDSRDCFVLFPGRTALNLSDLSAADRGNQMGLNKKNLNCFRY